MFSSCIARDPARWIDDTVEGGGRHILAFDGLRGLLAVWVFVAHAIELGPCTRLAGHLRPWLAVDIFIVLSGFVIFHLLSRGEDYGVFVTRRFFRLFPIFAVCFLFALLLRAATDSNDEIAFGLPRGTKQLFPYLATHAAMLHGMVPEQWLPLSSEAILPPAWSISVEWQFYLLAPVFFALLMRPRWSFVAPFLLLLAMRVLIERHALGVVVPHSPRDLTFNMNAFLPLKIEFFAAGAISWLLWKALSERTVQVSPRFRWAALAGAPLIGCATGSVALAMWVAVFVWIVDAQFGGGASRWSRGMAGILSWKGTRWLGAVSYPFYLVHVPTLFLMRIELGKVAAAATPAAFAILLTLSAAVAALGLAWGLHVWIEKPAMAFANRLTARRQAMPAPIGPAPIKL